MKYIAKAWLVNLIIALSASSRKRPSSNFTYVSQRSIEARCHTFGSGLTYERRAGKKRRWPYANGSVYAAAVQDMRSEDDSLGKGESVKMEELCITTDFQSSIPSSACN